MMNYTTPTIIASYVYCPRLCYLNKFFPYSGKKTEKTVLGLFEHDVFAKHSELARIDWKNQNEFTKNENDSNNSRIDKVLEFAIKISKENYAQFLDILKNDLDTLRLRLSILDTIRIKHVKALIDRGISFFEAIDLVLPWQIEQRFYSEKYRIKGRADSIYKTIDGGLLIEDIKSHNTRLDAFIHRDEHKAQLTTYAVLAEEAYQRPVNSVQILYSQDLSTEKFEISEDDKFEIIRIKKESENIVEKGIPPKLEGENALKCQFCYRKKFCFGLERTEDEKLDDVDFEPLKMEAKV